MDRFAPGQVGMALAELTCRPLEIGSPGETVSKPAPERRLDGSAQPRPPSFLENSLFSGGRTCGEPSFETVSPREPKVARESAFPRQELLTAFQRLSQEQPS